MHPTMKSPHYLNGMAEHFARLLNDARAIETTGNAYDDPRTAHEVSGACVVMVKQCIDAFCDVTTRFNDKFDRERFLTACKPPRARVKTVASLRDAVSTALKHPHARVIMRDL